MLTLDITASLAKIITPTMGIPDQELAAIRTPLRRYTLDILAEREKGMHGWAMNPYDRAMINRVKDAAKRAASMQVQTVVWIGIGGSGLGPKVIQEVFESPSTPSFIVVDTIDPALLSMQLNVIDWENALIVVVSKSGGTLETMSAFYAMYEKLKEAHKGKAAAHVIALTDPHGGSLRSFAIDNDIAMLPIPPDVGRRYSIFTPVGLLALALLNGDVDAFCRGAKEMDTLCQETLVDDNPAAKLAAVQFILDTKRGYPLRVIMPYSGRLASFGRWEQQLIAESLGKTELQNPIPMAALGTQDQHSLLQQWMAGPRNAWHLFVREIEKPRLAVPSKTGPSFEFIADKTFSQLLDACYEGTSQALTSAKRPHVTIALQRLDESHLGQLFFLCLMEVIYLGKLYRLDVYGQPAVEIGKTITKQILSKGRQE
jgi:glucose-6-phosphate isomerase